MKKAIVKFYDGETKTFFDVYNINDGFNMIKIYTGYSDGAITPEIYMFDANNVESILWKEIKENEKKSEG